MFDPDDRTPTITERITLLKWIKALLLTQVVIDVVIILVLIGYLLFIK